MTTLEKIELSATQHVTDAGVAALARLPRLREVSVEAVPGVTPAAASYFGPGVRVNVP